MAKFSRRDIKQFFQDTIKESYEPTKKNLKESTSSRKETPVRSGMSKRDLQAAIREAIRLGYTLRGDDPRAEVYGGEWEGMDMRDENLDPVDDEMELELMGDLPYSIDDSSDVLDLPRDHLLRYRKDRDLERLMRSQDRSSTLDNLYSDDEEDMEMPYMGFDDPLVMEGAAQGDTQVRVEALAVLAMSPLLLSGYVLHPQVRGMINPHVKQGEEVLKNWVEQNKADWEPLLDQLGVL